MLISYFHVPCYETAISAQMGIEDPAAISPSMTALEVGIDFFSKLMFVSLELPNTPHNFDPHVGVSLVA